MTAPASGAEESSPAKDYTAWMSGSGRWTETAHWWDGLPNPFQRVEIHVLMNASWMKCGKVPGTSSSGSKRRGLVGTNFPQSRRPLNNQIRVSRTRGDYYLRSSALIFHIISSHPWDGRIRQANIDVSHWLARRHGLRKKRFVRFGLWLATNH